MVALTSGESVPEWISRVNVGEILPITLEASVPFDREQLLGEALARRGRSGEGVDAFCAPGPGTGDEFLEPLELLLRSIEDEAQLTILGRWIMRRFLGRLLDVRLQIVEHVRTDPGVRDERIVEPIAVVGAPRTGTTILHALLAADPRHRVPLGWELLRPVPPPVPATHATDPRIELADLELRLPQLVSSGLESIHAYSGRMNKECLSAMSFSFRSEEFVSRCAVSSYSDWLQGCDMTPAYEMHRLVLQILQRRMPTSRWVLKSPVHLHNLDPLLAAYPDARLIVTHRDPLAILGSVTSLIARLRSAHSDQVSIVDIGRYHAELYFSDLDGLRSRTLAGGFEGLPIAHVSFTEFRADPVAEIDRIHVELGVSMPAEVRAQIAVAATRVHEPASAHAPSLVEMGLDPRAERDRFEPYCRAFGVHEEF